MSQIIADDALSIVERLQNTDLSGSVVVITGASGLLGTHILSALGLLEAMGRGPDRLFAISKSNFPKFANPIAPSTTTLQLDLTRPFDSLKLPRADYIVHAAGYGQPNKFMADPLSTIDLNTRVTMKLIESLSDSGRLLFASTSEIYSGLSDSPFIESQIGTTSPQHVRAPYIEGKRCGEAICHATLGANRRYISARIALAYGPGVFSTDDRVLYSFIRQSINRGRIEVADLGLANRTYCYVSDTVYMLLSLLFNSDLVGVFNVGGISRTSIKDLAILVGELTNSEVVFGINEEATSGAPAEVCLDVSKALRATKQEKFVSLRDGIGRTVRWWRETS